MGGGRSEHKNSERAALPPKGVKFGRTKFIVLSISNAPVVMATVGVVREGWGDKQNRLGRWQRRYLRLERNRFSYSHRENAETVSSSKGGDKRQKEDEAVEFSLLSLLSADPKPKDDRVIVLRFGSKRQAEITLERSAVEAVTGDSLDPPPSGAATSKAPSTVLTLRVSGALDQAHWIADLRRLSEECRTCFRTAFQEVR